MRLVLGSIEAEFCSDVWSVKNEGENEKMLPNFARKYSFESSWRDLQDLHTFAPSDSNLETMRSASGKRHPGEKHNPGEETSRPQQCRELWIQNSTKARQTFSHLNFLSFVSRMSHILCNWCPKFIRFDGFLSGIQQLLREKMYPIFSLKFSRFRS